MNTKINEASFKAMPLKQLPKKSRKLNKIPDFFRDRELFDSEKDMVTEGYFHYNHEDVMNSNSNFTNRLLYQSVVDTYAENIMNGRSYLNRKIEEPIVVYDY